LRPVTRYLYAHSDIRPHLSAGLPTPAAALLLLLARDSRPALQRAAPTAAIEARGATHYLYDGGEAARVGLPQLAAELRAAAAACRQLQRTAARDAAAAAAAAQAAATAAATAAADRRRADAKAALRRGQETAQKRRFGGAASPPALRRGDAPEGRGTAARGGGGGGGGARGGGGGRGRPGSAPVAAGTTRGITAGPTGAIGSEAGRPLHMATGRLELLLQHAATVS
jgi:hypothetical protein